MISRILRLNGIKASSCGSGFSLTISVVVFVVRRGLPTVPDKPVVPDSPVAPVTADNWELTEGAMVDASSETDVPVSELPPLPGNIGDALPVTN